MKGFVFSTSLCYQRSYQFYCLNRSKQEPPRLTSLQALQCILCPAGQKLQEDLGSTELVNGWTQRS